MGMFDRIWFICPGCKESLEAQSKSGLSLLTDFSSSEVPYAIAADIRDDLLYCKRCDKSWRIVEEKPIGHVAMTLEDYP